MKVTAIVMIIVVPILNIALNCSLKVNAGKSDSFLKALLSEKFIYSFIIGVMSILCLLALYSTKIELSRGILLMGAMSIFGGSLYGVIFLEEKLTNIEWAILIFIGALMIYRLIFVSNNN